MFHGNGKKRRKQEEWKEERTILKVTEKRRGR